MKKVSWFLAFFLVSSASQAYNPSDYTGVLKSLNGCSIEIYSDKTEVRNFLNLKNESMYIHPQNENGEREINFSTASNRIRVSQQELEKLINAFNNCVNN